MMSLRRIYPRLLENKIAVFFYFIIINLPLLILTFDAANLSDDSAFTNLFAVKARFSPILPLLFETTGGHEGGHFAPVYNLTNILITYISTNPVFFHFIIMLFYIATAFLVFLLIDRYCGDKTLGLFAGTLFAINYYTGFKALTWNCFHSHLTNTFTGLSCMYFLIRYLKEKKKYLLLICCLFFLLTIFNYESGFVFFPALLIVLSFSLLKKQITFKKSISFILIISLIMALFPVGAYLKTGNAAPLSYRFNLKGKWDRSAPGYLFYANDLFIKSSGLSVIYNKLFFNKLKKDARLKKIVIESVRENKKFNIKNFPLKFIVLLSIAGTFIALMLILMLWIIFQNIRKQTYLFVTIYMCLFLIYLVIFYRTDVANAIAIFSSIIIADIIISFLRDPRKWRRAAGMSILGLYLFITSWVILDRFDDCYRKSFFGLSKIAVQGPDKIYQDINKKIGRFAREGIIFFAHDYSQYHETGDFNRIGDMLDLGDFTCLNATAYYRDLMKTDIPRKYRDKSFSEFYSDLVSNPNNKKIIVSSLDDAVEYLRKNKIDFKIEVIYISKDYRITRLNRHSL